MWDGREPSLTHQSIDARFVHAQALNPPTADQSAQIVRFESGIFTAQNFDNAARFLYADHAAGGARALSQQPFVAAAPAPAVNPTVLPVFDLYTSWASLNGHDEVSVARESFARGQAIFNAEGPKGAYGVWLSQRRGCWQ